MGFLKIILSPKVSLIIFVLISIYILYRIILYLRKRSIEKLIYYRNFSEEGVYARDTVLLTEVIINPTFFPLFLINVGCYYSTEFEIDGVEVNINEKVQYFTSRFNILPFTKITRTHEFKCKVRNYYKLDTVEIFCNKEIMYISAPDELYVYPEPFDKELLPQLNLLGNEVSRNRFIKDPFCISGLRNYLPGDPINSINFKASARSLRGGVRELVVNNNDFSSQLNIMVYMDFNVPSFLKTETSQYNNLIEVGLSFSTYIIQEAIKQGGKAGFASNSRSKSVYYSPNAGRSYMLDIFKNMASLSPSAGMSFSALLDHDIRRELYDTDFCIITFYTDAELDSRIKQLRRLGKGVTIIQLDKLSYTVS